MLPPLKPHETTLTGRQVEVAGRPQRDGVWERIDALLDAHLEQMATDPSGWDALYWDPLDGRFWERTYPDGHLHGGGAPELRVLSAYDAFRKYGATHAPSAGPVYELDARRFHTLDQFFDEVSRGLIPDTTWGRNLDAFRDILAGGFGTRPEGFTVRWQNHALSRQRLGYPETVRQLDQRLRQCHPSNRDAVAARLADARAERGPTVFDWVMEIICEYALARSDSGYRVTLVLD